MKVLVYFLAVVAIGAAAGCGGDSNSGGASSGDKTSDVCEITANGLELLASEVHEGDSVAAAIKFLGPGACVYLAKTVFNDPFNTVDAEIELPSGEAIHFEGPAEELVAPTQEPEPSSGIDVERLIACVKSYSVQFLVDECADGYIEP